MTSEMDAALASESTWFPQRERRRRVHQLRTAGHPDRQLSRAGPPAGGGGLPGKPVRAARRPLPPARAGAADGAVPGGALPAAPRAADLAVVYLAVILPDDLAARLPPVTKGWRDFTARTTFTERFFAPRPDPRDTAGDRPPLYFLHVLLPHHPWMLLRTGQRFTLQRGDVGLSNERWLDDEWAATIRYQRHLLQLQYVDTVVGALVSQLRDAGVYDDALIVITADHGASLRSGFPFLQATEASFVDIAAVPLFFKRPGQRQGETVDTNVETIDILPTLAAALGVRLPWTADGANVLDPAWNGRPAKTMLAGGVTRRMAGPADLHGAVMARVRHKLALFDGGDPLNAPAAGGRADLIGERATDYPPAATDIEVTVDAPELLGAIDPVGDFVPAHITGSAASAGRGAQRRGRGDYAAVPLQHIRPRRRLGDDRRSRSVAAGRQYARGVRCQGARRRRRRPGGSVCRRWRTARPQSGP